MQSARSLVRSAPVRSRATNHAGIPRRQTTARVASPVSSQQATEERAKLSAERAGALLEGAIQECSSVSSGSSRASDTERSLNLGPGQLNLGPVTGLSTAKYGQMLDTFLCNPSFANHVVTCSPRLPLQTALRPARTTPPCNVTLRWSL